MDYITGEFTSFGDPISVKDNMDELLENLIRIEFRFPPKSRFYFPIFSDYASRNSEGIIANSCGLLIIIFAVKTTVTK